MKDTSRYILLPRKGFLSTSLNNNDSGIDDLPHIKNVTEQYKTNIKLNKAKHPITVVDSVCNSGPKLIIMESEIGDSYLGKQLLENFRVLKEQMHSRPIVNPDNNLIDSSSDIDKLKRIKIKVTVIDKKNNAPVVNANVIAYFDIENKKSSLAVTDSKGNAQLTWSKILPYIPQLVVIPDKHNPAYWGSNQKNIAIADELLIPIDPVNTDFKDCMRTLYPTPQFYPKLGITVVKG